MHSKFTLKIAPALVENVIGSFLIPVQHGHVLPCKSSANSLDSATKAYDGCFEIGSVILVIR